ncbi:hypothetical protein G7Z17_g13211 [Cylindrodendrum hubeiense]|uniref:Uncharacterized protein n=1 Tax=Cylindrodendrum hubeiense TaxID=595255 RepID=A0A9P5GXE9_9HYPO|nr:hypothetical protein G7Z17_g13211 [Cylindrodendrum hubeiense]
MSTTAAPMACTHGTHARTAPKSPTAPTASTTPHDTHRHHTPMVSAFSGHWDSAVRSFARCKACPVSAISTPTSSSPNDSQGWTPHATYRPGGPWESFGGRVFASRRF